MPCAPPKTAKSAWPWPAPDLVICAGRHEFLADARAVANLDGLSLDRKTHAVRRKQPIYFSSTLVKAMSFRARL